MDIQVEKYIKEMEKTAKGGGLLSVIGPLASLPKNVLMTYLTAAVASGLIGGAGLGLSASYIKSKNQKLLSLSRKKEFYDKKVREMNNANWLNDVMALKKKLDTSKLSDEERAELETKYKKLINS